MDGNDLREIVHDDYRQALSGMKRERDELYGVLQGLVGLAEKGSAPLHIYKQAIINAREILDKIKECE